MGLHAAPKRPPRTRLVVITALAAAAVVGAAWLLGSTSSARQQAAEPAPTPTSRDVAAVTSAASSRSAPGNRPRPATREIPATASDTQYSASASTATPATSLTSPDPSTDFPAGTANAILIPTQQVTAPIVGDCVIRNRTMDPPADVKELCQWAGGASLDKRAEPVVSVVTGHVNYVGQGPGAFYRLGELQVGDPILTAGSEGWPIRWAVTAVARYTKTNPIPAAVFTQADSGRRTLRLITCGGELDASGNYDENIVVTAVVTP